MMNAVFKFDISARALRYEIGESMEGIIYFSKVKFFSVLEKNYWELWQMCFFAESKKRGL